MKSAQSMNRNTPEDDDLGQATVRELIVQLALAEDEHRNTASPQRIAALTRREQAILEALQRNRLGPPGSSNPKPLGSLMAAPDDDLVVN